MLTWGTRNSAGGVVQYCQDTIGGRTVFGVNWINVDCFSNHGNNGSNVGLVLAGSAVNGAFVNAGSNSLIRGSLNSDVAGRCIFNVRNGAVVGTVPLPMSLALVGLALAGLGLASRKKRAVQGLCSNARRAPGRLFRGPRAGIGVAARTMH